MSKCLALLLLATSQYLTFYDRDNGQTVRVPAGQVVTIKLMVPQGARSCLPSRSRAWHPSLSPPWLLHRSSNGRWLQSVMRSAARSRG